MKQLNLKNAISMTLLTLLASAALAKAPLSVATPPGIFRTHIGNFEVTSLSDGTADLPMAKLLTNVTAAEYKKSLEKESMSDPFESSVNVFVINTGEKLILIDAGAGALFGPTLGKMLSNLKVAGYQPEQVDAVLLTHMHPDHVGGLAANGKMTFPNAIIYADVAESDFWLNPENVKKANDANKGFFDGVIASLSPYKMSAKLKPLKDGSEIFPGIKSLSAAGHTAGHMIFSIESRGQKLVILGDLVHVAAVQFSNTNVGIAFDADSKQSEHYRVKAFTEAAKQGYLIAGSHLSFPGIGHIRNEKKAFTYIPVNYTR